jgi:hypothetical protein
MYKILFLCLLTGLLGACSSIERRTAMSSASAPSSSSPVASLGDPIFELAGPVRTAQSQVDASEVYKGPQTAAVAPVADRRTGGGPADERLRAEIQQSIRHQLDSSGIFAGVVALDRPDEGNEAEIIIQPTLVGAPGYGRDGLELEVRVTEKTKRKLVLDERYADDNPNDRLQIAITELEDDLGSHYRK